MTSASGPPGRARSGYLDNGSGRPLHPAAREVMLAALDSGYADPRRLHGPGRQARLLLDNARAVIAECLGLYPDEVSFAGSGTDAVHRGLLGLHRGRSRDGESIAHSAIEHSAVLQAIRWSEAPAVSIPVDRSGSLSPEALGAALDRLGRPPTVVAIQLANAEVGTVQPITELAARASGVPLFVDAAAGLGSAPLADGWSVAAASAHKWGGPAGIGLLLVRKGVRWRNPFPADDRIDQRTVGFENIPAALGAAAALRAVLSESAGRERRLRELGSRLSRGLARIPDVELIGDPEHGLPGTVAFSCLYVDGEALVTGLDQRGLAVASGSACSASTIAPSHVLAAMGVLTHGNVRVSFGADSDEDEADALVVAVAQIATELRSAAGLPQ
ncbi:MAG: cysteine desulfurase family protein [Nocardioides sp.]